MRNKIILSKKTKLTLVTLGLIALIIIVLFGYNKISKIAVDGWSKHIEAYENSDEIDDTLKKIF